MNGDYVSKQAACDCCLTVGHIMIESGDFMEVRQRYDAQNMRQLFEGISVIEVFDFSLQESFIEYRYCLLMNTCEQKRNVEFMQHQLHMI